MVPNSSWFVCSSRTIVLLTDWLEHVPPEGWFTLYSKTSIEILMPSKTFQRKSFTFSLPEENTPVKSPQGQVDNPFSFSFSKVKPTKLSGGAVKVVDSSTFKISKTIAAAEVTVEQMMTVNSM